MPSPHPRGGLTIRWLRMNVPLCLENRELCLRAVHKFGTALRYLTPLQHDREIVTKSISRHGKSIQYASQELQQDNDMILIAIKTHPEHIRKCTPSEDLLAKCIRVNPDVFYQLSNHSRRIPSIITALLQTARDRWRSLHHEDQMNPIYICMVLQQGPLRIELPEEWFLNPKNILAVVHIEPKVLMQIPVEVKYPHDMLRAIAKNAKCILYTTELFNCNFIKHAVYINPEVIAHLHTIGIVSKPLEMFAVRCKPSILPLCKYRHEFTIPILSSYAYDRSALQYFMLAIRLPMNPIEKLTKHGPDHKAMLLRRIGSYLYIHISSKEREVYRKTLQALKQ